MLDLPHCHFYQVFFTAKSGRESSLASDGCSRVPLTHFQQTNGTLLPASIQEPALLHTQILRKIQDDQWNADIL